MHGDDIRVRRTKRTLGNGSMEEPMCGVNMVQYVCRAGSLAEDGYVRSISTERVDVAPDPFQGCTLVGEAIIANASIARRLCPFTQRRARCRAEDANTKAGRSVSFMCKG